MALPRWSTTTSSTPRTWSASSTPTSATGFASRKQASRDGVDGAQTRLAAAQDLKSRLELILEGEAPYDIFVRWKPLAEQPIGWNPDLNDGVRLNIRPFMTAEVLRHNKKPKLNINWDKDRGKDVESAPWFTVFERRPHQ